MIRALLAADGTKVATSLADSLPHGSESVASRPHDRRVEAAAQRLVAELRDECSEVGVSARGLNVAGMEAGVRAFAAEAKRYGATAERMIVLLKECLRDERLPQNDRVLYDSLLSNVVKWAIDAYYSTPASSPSPDG